MKIMEEARIRKIIHSYALVFRYHFLDELVLQPNYLLTYTLDGNPGFFNSAMNITLDSGRLERELPQIENYFKVRQKIPAIALETGTSSLELREFIEAKGYTKIERENCAMWGKSTDAFRATDLPAEQVKFRIIQDYDNFQDYLTAAANGWNDVLDYSVHAAPLSKLFQHPHDGVKVFHIVGYIDNIPVCTSTLGIYFDMAHLINVSVIPSWRRNGIASKMIANAMNLAKESNATELYCCSDESDQPGTALMQKNGFILELTQVMYCKK